MATLTLITVPIGNLGDLTERQRSALAGAGLFLVEDTRTFRSLLKHLSLPTENKTIESLHDHSGPIKIEQYLKRLDAGKDFYVVSEAGSPIVSDPAFPLVRAALERGHQIDSYPGASSPVVALELSGLPPIPFHFWGFLPRERPKRKSLFDEMEKVPQTQILFESPHRLKNSISELFERFPWAEICMARELTKKFQAVYRWDAMAWEQEREELKVMGECVIVLSLSGAPELRSLEGRKLGQLADECLAKKGHPKAVAKLLSEITGKKVKEVYQELSRN